MKKLFAIAIGQDEQTGEYCAIVSSLTDQKHRIVSDSRVKFLLLKMNKLIREKTKQVRNFPIVEPSRMIMANGNGVSRLIEPARN